MRIFLTGASGYIGLHILRDLLAAGHEVTALVRTSGKLGPFANSPQLTIVTGDLNEPDQILRALRGHEVCIHCAFIWGDPGTELELRDTAATARLFDASGQAGIARCIYLSSVAAHRPFSAEMQEVERLSATDYYGATKAAGELFFRAACADGGMTGIVVRPGLVVGPPAFDDGSFRSDRRLSGMVAAAVEGRELEVVAGDGRQFADVDMVARVVNSLVSTGEPEDAYFCMDPTIISWEWIAGKVVEWLGSTSALRLLPANNEKPVPHFLTSRLELLVGGTCDARAALQAHIVHLATASAKPGH